MTSFDVGALVAADAHEKEFDVLVLDDQPIEAFFWLNHLVPEARVLACSSQQEFMNLLHGVGAPGTQPKPNPVMAIFDLQLDPNPDAVLGGDQTTTSLTCLHLLRDPEFSPFPDLPVVIDTHGLDHGRDMLAVFAAELNGGSILTGRKTWRDHQALARMIRSVAASAPCATTEQAHRLAPELTRVDHVSVKTAATRPPDSLMPFLLGEPWKREYWLQMSISNNHTMALQKALDVEEHKGAARAAWYTRTYLRLCPYWSLSGRSFHQLKDGFVDLTRPADVVADPKLWEEATKRATQYTAEFLGTYGSVLGMSEIRKFMAEQGAAPEAA